MLNLFSCNIKPFFIIACFLGIASSYSFAFQRNNSPVFVRNAGQIIDDQGKTRPDIFFSIDIDGAKVYFHRRGVSYVFHRITTIKSPGFFEKKSTFFSKNDNCAEVFRLDLEPVSQGQKTYPETLEPSVQQRSFYLEQCPEGIISKCAEKIIYRNVYRNIDWIFSTNAQGSLKHDFIVHPGGNPHQIALKYSGFQAMELTSNGNLRVETPIAVLKEEIPFSFLMPNHELIPIKYNLTKNTVSFDVPIYPKSETLVIDPLATVWATYHGGTSVDHDADLAVDLENNPIITGFTSSIDFPTTTGVLTSKNSGLNDVFISKFNSSGTKLWSTYFGGKNDDRGYGVAVSFSNEIAITGTSDSPKIPFSEKGFMKIPAGGSDAFIAKFSTDGELFFSTFLGGKRLDEGTSIIFDHEGNIITCGTTECIDFPTTQGAFLQRFQAGGSDAFLAKFSPKGDRIWATYLGGHSPDFGNDLAFFNQKLFILGTTQSANFPINKSASIRNKTIDIMGDVYLASFDLDGKLDWSTAYGGKKSDEGLSLAIDFDGYINICGYTQSEDLPTTAGVAQNKFSGYTDGYIAQFTAAGEPVWATYLGGSGIEQCNALAVNPRNKSIYVVGKTNSKNFPTSPNAIMFTAAGAFDAFVAQFSNSGKQLWASYYGGSNDDESYAIATHSNDDVFMGGRTVSKNFPVKAPSSQPNLSGNWDSFLIKFNETDPTMSPDNTMFVSNEIPPDENIFTFKVTVKDAKCKGGSDGAIYLEITGGTKPYTFLWTNGATTQNLLNVPAGKYSVKVTDSNGFIQDYYVEINGRNEYKGIEIKEPSNGVQISLTPVASTCPNSGDGAIRTAASGGQAPYSYRWNNGSTESALKNINPGEYTVTITDANGCSAIETTKIPTMQPFVVTAQTINSSCSGTNDGKITLNINGGTPPYSFNWSNGANTKDISGLQGGNYTVTVLDANKCSTTVSSIITQGAAISVVLNANSSKCDGAKDGSVTASVVGGTPPFTYKWSNGAITKDITGINPGTYTVTISDKNNCSTNASAVVSQPVAIKLTLNPTNPLCHDSKNGAIEAVVVGGKEPYSFIWSNGQSTQKIIQLPEGQYSLTVTDANGCKINSTTKLVTPEQIIVDIKLEGGGCNDVSGSAAAIASAKGGTPPLKFNWSNGVQSKELKGVPAGDYTLTITDAFGCTVAKSVKIIQNIPMTATLLVKEVDCEGGSTAGIDLTINGGVTPLTYVWSNGNKSEDLVNIPSGLYSVTITDAHKCILTQSVTIKSREKLKISEKVSSITCNGINNGEIEIAVQGGIPPYNYLWSNSNTTNILKNLSAGVYSVEISDSKGCKVKKDFTLNQPATLLASSKKTDASCEKGNDGKIEITVIGGTPPFIYEWNNGQKTKDLVSLREGSYNLKITDSQGCSASIGAQIQRPKTFILELNKTDLTCGAANDGAINTKITNGEAPFSYAWSNGNTTPELKNIKEGIYTVTVLDSKGCKQTGSITVNKPAALTLKTIPKNISCTDGKDGSIETQVSGGKEPFSFKWNTGSTERAISSLSKGAYSVTISDANGCIATSAVVITEPAPLMVGLEPKNISCGGTSDGAIKSNITGGTPPYKYLWNNASTTQNLANVTEGKYTLKVTDSNGCFTENSTTLTKPSAITVTIDKKDLSCGGTNDGTATAIVSGGKEPYAYAWSNLSAKKEVTQLKEGELTLTVTDANGCKSTAKVTLSRPPAITLKLSSKNISCSGKSDGKIESIVSGGKEPFSFKWNTGSTERGISSLAKGAYSVTISDANGCIATANANISEPTPLTAVLTPKNISCGATADGAIQATVTGGMEPFNYSWNNNATTKNLTNLSEGNYTLKVTDANGCQTEATVNLTKPSAMTVTIDKKDLSCGGTNDGTATAIVSGGKEPYAYAWSNLSAKKEVTQLKEGELTLTVTDANGCKSTAKVTLSRPPAITLKLNSKNISCSGKSDGKIESMVSGGKEPFSFKWNTGSTEKAISSLSKGAYSVTISDANGCIATANANISEPTSLTAVLTPKNISCGATADGAIQATVTGGMEPFNYSWNNNATTKNLTNLSEGNYTLKVTDANGCQTEATVNLTKPSAITVTIDKKDLSCGGTNDGTATAIVSGGKEPYAYAWSNLSAKKEVTQLKEGELTLTVTDANGCKSTAKVTLSRPPAITLKLSSKNISCSGKSDGKIESIISGGKEPFSFKWNTGSTERAISALAKGAYSVTISDANGCIATANANISEPTPLTAVLTPKNITCGATADGAIQATVTGGMEPFNYSWNNNATTKNLTNLSEGNYTLKVTDANGCQTEATVNLTKPSAITVTIDKKDLSCGGTNDGTATAIVSGGKEPYAYAWSNLSAKKEVTQLKEGELTLTVTDANGCKSTAKVTLIRPKELVAKINKKDISCSGGKDGKLEVLISSGKDPFIYNWSNLKSGNVLDGLDAGVYSVTVTDANGCKTNLNATIKAPNPLSIQLSSKDVTCGGTDDGSISTKVTGGIEPLKFNWSNGKSTQNITNLEQGSYSITVTDANNCKAESTVSVGKPAQLNASLIKVDLTCGINNDGSIKVAVSGGKMPYSFVWSNGLTSQELTKLPEGKYSVTITDGAGCKSNLTTILTKPDPLLFQIRKKDITCANVNDGKAEVAITSGKEPFTYIWSNKATTNNIEELGEGTFSVTITDANGCTSNASTIIKKPTPIAVTLSGKDVSCSGTNDGSITAKVSGGLEPYKYLWSSGETTNNLSKAEVGNFKLTVTDANGCVGEGTIEIKKPNSFTLSITKKDLSCGATNDGSAKVSVSGGKQPYTYLWSNQTNKSEVSLLKEGDIEVTVTDANGCKVTAKETLVKPGNITVKLNSNNPKCSGKADGNAEAIVTGGKEPFSFVWSNKKTSSKVDGLSEGIISVTVTDANGCKQNSTVTLKDPEPLKLVLIATDLTCSGKMDGKIVSKISGGTSPYTYKWSSGGTTESIQDVDAGEYSLTVVDANGCMINDKKIITKPGTLKISLIASNVKCFEGKDGSIQTTLTGGTEPYTYKWNSGQLTKDLNNLAKGEYSVTITDSKGCSSSEKIEITQPEQPEIKLDGSSEICEGQNRELTAPDYFKTYKWSNGGVGKSISVSKSGIYTVDLITESGCKTTSKTVRISVSSPPPTPKITRQGDSLISSESDRYQWYLNNVAIVSGINKIFIAKVKGEYKVRITDEKGCTAVSAGMQVSPQKIEKPIENNDITCYPNPTNSELNIDIKNTKLEILDVKIVSPNGIIVYQKRISATEKTFSETIEDIKSKGTPSGRYVLTVKGKNINVTQTITVN